MASEEITSLPLVTAPARGDAAAAVSRLVEALEEHEDVKEVLVQREIFGVKSLVNIPSPATGA